MRLERRSCERGYVLVVLAGTLLILLGFSALAVDVGYMYSARAKLQAAADAAALAGAFTFISTPEAPQPATAQERATLAAINNYVMGSQITLADFPYPPIVDVNNQLVTVDLDHQERTLFGVALGWMGATIRVRAVAEAAKTPCGACAKPWFIMNTILASDSPCTTGVSPPVCPGQCLVDPATLETNHTFVDPLIGGPFRVKPGQPGNAIAPGQFYAIDLTALRGGSVYRDTISTCDPNSSIFCHEQYQVEPGNMIGPTKQGTLDFTTLFGTVTPDRWVDYDHLNGKPQIRSGQTDQLIETSHQMAVAPIWNSCTADFIASGCDFGTGRQIWLEVVGFAYIFIDGVEGNDVNAHLIGVSGCSNGGSCPPNVTGPFAFPIRLVRTE